MRNEYIILFEMSRNKYKPYVDMYLNNTEWHKKKRELLKAQQKFKKSKKKKMTEIEPLQLAF